MLNYSRYEIIDKSSNKLVSKGVSTESNYNFKMVDMQRGKHIEYSFNNPLHMNDFKCKGIQIFQTSLAGKSVRRDTTDIIIPRLKQRKMILKSI